MSTMRATTYQGIADALGPRKPSVKLANNTYAWRNWDPDGGGFVVTLHRYPIACLRPDGSIVVTDAGWWTSTTKNRLNQILHAAETDGVMYGLRSHRGAALLCKRAETGEYETFEWSDESWPVYAWTDEPWPGIIVVEGATWRHPASDEAAILGYHAVNA